MGVNYFGPLYVRQGRSNVKCYGCLFTCLFVRAVHIEVVHSLDTNGFINALRRFDRLRGCSATIYSENGTNFHAGQIELRKLLSKWNQTTIHDFLCQMNNIWKFNPPGASHMDDAWERINRSICTILRALLELQQLLSDECWNLHDLSYKDYKQPTFADKWAANQRTLNHSHQIIWQAPLVTTSKHV